MELQANTLPYLINTLWSYAIHLVQNASSTIYGLKHFLEAANGWYDFKTYNPFKLRRSAGVGMLLFTHVWIAWFRLWHRVWTDIIKPVD